MTVVLSIIFFVLGACTVDISKSGEYRVNSKRKMATGNKCIYNSEQALTTVGDVIIGDCDAADIGDVVVLKKLE